MAEKQILERLGSKLINTRINQFSVQRNSTRAKVLVLYMADPSLIPGTTYAPLSTEQCLACSQNQDKAKPNKAYFVLYTNLNNILININYLNILSLYI